MCPAPRLPPGGGPCRRTDPRNTGEGSLPLQQGSVIERLLLRLATWQLRAPWQVLLLGLVLTGTGLWLSRGLELRTRFDQLLPDDQPSVVELKHLSQRTAGSSSIFVLLEGADRDTLRRVGGGLLPPLRAVGGPWVVSAEDGVQTARA